jgi:hypothetical protein
MGSACRLRNGTWVIADGGDRVLVVQADGSVRETSVDQQGREPLIIGSEGSNVDIWYVVGDGGYFGESILRLDTRTLGTQELFAEEKISS